MNTCKNCKYWTGRPTEDGECRRYPPQIVAMVEKGEYEERITTDARCFHPDRHETDWCGEHSPVV